MWFGLVGSRNLGECSCDTRQSSWPPTADELAHREDCRKVAHWLLCLKVVTRLVMQHPELTQPIMPKEKPEWGLVSGGARGADTLLMDAAKMQGVPAGRLKVIRPKTGNRPFAERAKERNTKVVEISDELIALFGPGPRSPGTSDTVSKALAKKIPTHVWHDGRWTSA